MAKCAKRRRFVLHQQLRRRQAMRGAVGVESLEPRQLLATTAQLSTEQPTIRLPVTFQGDAAGTISWQTMAAGQLTWLNATGDVRAAGLPATFKSFCVDGLQSVSWGTVHTFPDFTSAVNAGPVGGTNAAMGVDRANLLTQLLNQFGPTDPAVGFTNATDAAALQVCIWEIVNDAVRTASGVSFDLSAGRFQIGAAGQSAAAVTQARQWLQSLDVNRSLTCCRLEVRLLTSPTLQDQFTWTSRCETLVDNGPDGVSCNTCSVGSPSSADNQLKAYTQGVITSVSGGGLSTAIILQRNQPASTSLTVCVAIAAASTPFGKGWTRTTAPTLTMQGTDPANPTAVSLVFSGDDIRVFRNVPDAAGQPVFYRATGQGTSDTFTFAGGQYLFRTAAGDTLTFNGFGESVPAAARGCLVSQTDASGNQLVYSFNPDGSTARLDSFTAAADAASPATLVEVQDYVYLPATDPNAGQVGRIDVRRGDGTLVRSVDFSYHDGTTAFGTLGDLAGMRALDPLGALLDAREYRYTTSTSGASLLAYTFDFDAVRRATAAGIDLATATNATVAPFATDAYQYDAGHRVTRHDLQGAGCSTCTGGIGTFTYAYASNPKPVLGSNLDWRTKSTETRPDGTQRIVYSNARAQPMLEVLRTTDGGVTKQYGTFTRYEARGQVIWRATPEAVTLPADLADIEQYPDLLNEVSGNFQYISDSSGLVEVTSYAATTTATATIAGSVDRFVSSTAVMKGDRGTPVTQESFAYFVQAAGGSTATPIASRTTYPNTTTAGSQTTTYAYTFAPGTTQIVSQRTTLPTITTSQNGSGVADVVEQVYDPVGRGIWSRDGDGFLRYTEYDQQTGAVTKSIVDVDTSRTTDFRNLPAGWLTPTGGGLHLVSTYEVDQLGRTVKATDPNGNVTFTVYDDVNHSTRTYVGWNAMTSSPTGPIQLSRRDLSGTYTETLTYSAAPAVDAEGRPTGTEPITYLQSLSRSLVNAAGQVIAVDRYTNFDGVVYSIAAATLGAEGVNYLRTRYAYNDQGQVERVQNPAGTITISTFDGLSRLTGTWVGTDDSTTNGFKWTPGSASATSNMAQVAASEYDNGGTGNGNLTKFTQIPGGGASPRVTQNFYDWRNRLVATKTGASADPSTEDPSVNRPLSFTDYDNLGRVTGQSVYDGDGVAIVDANADGVPDKPAAGVLRSSRLSFYDAQDRAYRTQELFVDQATGATGSARLTTTVFYDRRGNVAMMIVPNAPVTQSRYDGAGRLTTSFSLGKVPNATWANATSLTASLVLQQTEYSYDAAGNVILAATRQRFHDAFTTAYGAIGTPTAGIPARVSFAASYYDAADRLAASVNVGTNGGVAYARPATVPASSDTALVTTYSYDSAGRVQDVTDPGGITARTLYDALGRTTATVANFTGGTPAAQADVTTLFTFDSAGRLGSRTAVQAAGAPSQVTGYVYGVFPATGSTIASNDVMAETRYPDPVTGLPSAAERDVYTANALGERTSFNDRAGTTHAYAYDVTGRQTADAITALGTGVDGAIRRIESAYSPLGHVTSVTSFDAPAGGTVINQVVRASNAYGQVTSEWQSHTGLVDPATTPRVQYTYAPGVGGNSSLLSRITYPDGYAVNYAYSGIDSAFSRPTSLSGLRAGATTAVPLETFKYLGAGPVIERSRPEVNVTLSMMNFNGATGDAGDKYTGLDRFSRVVEQRWAKGTTATATVLDHYAYTYDRNSNRLTRSNALAAAFSETYSYDALNQLQSFTVASGTTTSQQWQFDALGNWTSVTTNGVNQNRTANAQNELTQVGGSSLAYSQTGNLTTDAQGRTLAYDAWNRLVRVTSADGLTWTTHAYDGLNRRITETLGPGPVTSTRDLFYSQDWQVLEERVRGADGSIPATADTRFIWSPVYVDAMIARDRNADGNSATGTGGLEERVHVLQDANWNTTAIIAATGVPGFTAGTVVNRFVYTPYGESQTLSASWAAPAAGSTPAAPWSHLFQGLKFNDVTGLANARNRDYSPTLGRFIERDPIGFEAGDNNWYRFVANGPTRRTDPWGLWPKRIIPVPSDPFSPNSQELPPGWPTVFPSPLPIPPPEVYELPFGPEELTCAQKTPSPTPHRLEVREYKSLLVPDPSSRPPRDTTDKAFMAWATAQARTILTQKGREFLLEAGYIPGTGFPAVAPCARPANKVFYKLLDVRVNETKDGKYEALIRAEWYY
ncbi:MAG: RHS repeat-associated core domain-containing protein [Planctomycetota bacterium]